MSPGSDNLHLHPLSLRLQVVSFRGQPPEQAVIHVFHGQGGSIGRGDESDYVLSDPEVSRNHAVISYENGEYLVTDHSTNGTFVNDSPVRLGAGQPYRIRDGDTFMMGSFQVVANLVSADGYPSEAPPVRREKTEALSRGAGPGIDFGEPEEGRDDYGELPELDDWQSGAKRPSWFPVGEEDASDIFDQGSSARGTPEERPPVPVLQRHLAQQAPPVPPAKVPVDSVRDEDSADQRVRGTGVPTGYIPGGAKFKDFAEGRLLPEEPGEEDSSARPDIRKEGSAQRSARGGEAPVEKGSRTGVEEPLPQPERAPITTPSGVRPRLDRDDLYHAGRFPANQVQLDLLAALLRGLGSPGLPVRPDEANEFVTQIGQLVREAIQGMINTLSLRDEFKREFYVPVTRIAPTDNNLFKHSANADDALSRAFSAGGSAYISPVESTRQAFQDIAAHHLALVAGMQAAVRSLLDRFSPLALEERIGKAGVLEGVLPQIRKAQMWEQFEKEYTKLKEQAEEDFQQVFGHYFERAYTEEIHRLRSAGFGGRQKSET